MPAVDGAKRMDAMWSAVELEDAPSLVVPVNDASRVPTALLAHDGQGFLDDIPVLDPDAHSEAADARSGQSAEQPEVDLGQAVFEGYAAARLSSVIKLGELGGSQGLAATNNLGIDGAQGCVGWSHGTSPCSETEYA